MDVPSLHEILSPRVRAGGLSLVQKPSEAAHAPMPEYAIAHDHVRAALTVDEIGDVLILLTRGDAVPMRFNRTASSPSGDWGHRAQTCLAYQVSIGGCLDQARKVKIDLGR